MTERPARIVDAHVHFWDPARADWYPYLVGAMELDIGETSGMARRFDLPTYRAEAGSWNVEKLVHVAAAAGRHSIDETLEIQQGSDADGHPDALIGGITPTESLADAVAQIDRQMQAASFRGVRPMGRFTGPLPDPDLLRVLQERGLVFEVLARPDQLEVAARGLAGFDDLLVVVEHTGWPHSKAEEERVVWQAGIEALAGLGPNVHCKLSGLSAAAGSIGADVFAPWLEPAIEAFGVDRCFVASNFPVDGLHGTLDELWSAFDAATAGLGDSSRDKLFATNAERVYRC
ncbi:MAG: amidohydrolase family protein [Acidimicrobiales bacterium]